MKILYKNVKVGNWIKLDLTRECKMLCSCISKKTCNDINPNQYYEVIEVFYELVRIILSNGTKTVFSIYHIKSIKYENIK
jgi:hypothetical protein